MRIHIIGGPGSGKTTLAKQLATTFSIPCYEMDLIGWERGFGPARSLEARLRDVNTIAVQPAWVTEGGAGTLEWSTALLQAADYIIWLDLPWSVARWRIIKRHIIKSWQGTNRHRGLGKLYRFLKGAHSFYTNTNDPTIGRMLIASLLSPYLEKVARCRRPADVASCVRRLLESGNIASQDTLLQN